MSTSVGGIVHLHVTSFHPPDSVISLCSFTCKQLDQDHTRCWWKRNQVLSKYIFLTLNHYLLQKAYWLNFSSSLENSGLSPYLYLEGTKEESVPLLFSGLHDPVSRSSKREKTEFRWFFFPSITYLLWGVYFMHKWILK